MNRRITIPSWDPNQFENLRKELEKVSGEVISFSQDEDEKVSCADNGDGDTERDPPSPQIDNMISQLAHIDRDLRQNRGQSNSTKKKLRRSSSAGSLSRKAPQPISNQHLHLRSKLQIKGCSARPGMKKSSTAASIRNNVAKRNLVVS